MPVDFPNFLLQLNDTINAENGENLAYLLRPTSPHGKDLVKQFKNATVSRAAINPIDIQLDNSCRHLEIHVQQLLGQYTKPMG